MDPTPETADIPRRRSRRILRTLLIGLAVLVAAGLVLLPYGVKWYFGDWLRDRGVVNVRIGDVDINPFTGAFAIESLEFEDDSGTHRAGHAALNLSWTDLINQRIRLSRVELRDAALKIRHTESNRWLIGTIVLGAQQAVEEVEQTEAESGWEFGIDRLEIADVAIDYRDPIIAREFVVDEAVLADFATWSPDQQTGIVLALSSLGAKLRVEGDARPFADTFELDLRVTSGDLAGQGLEALLAEYGFESVEGLLGTDARVKVAVPPGDGETEIEIDGRLDLSELAMVHQEGQLGLGRLEWDGTVRLTITPDASRLQTEGKLDIDTAALGAPAAGIALELDQFDWDGRLDQQIDIDQTEDAASGDQSLSGAGDLNYQGLRITLAAGDDSSDPGAASSELSVDKFSANTSELLLRLGAGQTQADWEGDLQLSDAGFETAPSRLTVGSLDWKGKVNVAIGEQGATVVADGGVEAGGLGFEDLIDPLRAGLDSIDWRGRLELATTAEEGGGADSAGWRVTGSGDLSAENAGARVPGEDRSLIDVAELRASLAEPRPGYSLTLAALEVLNVKLFERVINNDGEPVHAISIARIGIDGIGIGERAVSLGDILIRDPALWIERQRDGVLEINAVNSDGDDASASTKNDDAPTGDKADTSISLAGLKTEGEARLVYVDRSVRPVARFELAPLELTLGAADGTAPDQDTPLDFKASIGRYGRIAFAGALRPGAEQAYVSGEGSLTDIDMISLDGFTRRAIGYSVESGTLSADLRVELQQQQLDSAADLTIRKLEIDPLKPDQQDEFSTELGVPLGVALSLLQDDQQTIQLEVPLKGDVSDLSVGIGDTLRQVMKKGLMAGMRTAATTYFAPLWPALAATKLFQAASKLSFRPVDFVAGEAALDAEKEAYLQEMAGLLGRRPKVSLTLCGRAVAADLAVLFPELEGELNESQEYALAELARSRHELVKDRLIDAGLDSARLVTCKGEVSPVDDGAPRVDFGV